MRNLNRFAAAERFDVGFKGPALLKMQKKNRYVTKCMSLGSLHEQIGRISVTVIGFS